MKLGINGVSIALLMQLGLSAVAAQSNEATKTKSWTLHHRILDPESSVATALSDWSIRGNVKLTIDPSAEESVLVEMSNDDDSLTEAFAIALTSSSAGWYQLKLQDDTSKTEILTSVPACHVRRANFRDEIMLQLQQGTAAALSVAYMPLVSPLAPESCADYTSLLPSGVPLKFESKISWETAVPGMLVGRPPPKPDGTVPPPKIMPPPGLKWIPGARPRKGNEPEEGAPPPETGIMAFAKRNWFILVPLMLMNFLGAGSEPNQAQTEGNSGPSAGGAAAGAAAVGAVAAGATGAASGGSPAVRRRGKKG